MPEESQPTEEESTGTAASENAPDDELPGDVVDEAERLTRLAREAVDDEESAAYREGRERLLADHDFVARVRPEDTGDVLVCHPAEWVAGDVVDPARIEDVDRAVEVPLEGPGDPEEWDAVEAHNSGIVDRVAEEHGDVHAANARAFADFMGNHYAKSVDSATAGEIREFLDEYYPRNAWPSDEQQAVVERSIRYVFEAADERLPSF